MRGSVLAAVGLAGCLASVPASAQDLRAGKSELSVSPVYTLGKHYGFHSGPDAKTDAAFGLGVQWHYNFDGHWSAGIDAEAGSADYAGTAVPSDGSSPFGFDSRIRTTTVRLAFDYNFSTAPFTPFVTGGIGLALIDPNLQTASASGACVRYPYWGQVCGGSAPSGTLIQLSYSGGIGVRYDLRPAPYFVRALYDTVWTEYGSSVGQTTAQQFRIDLGVKF